MFHITFLEPCTIKLSMLFKFCMHGVVVTHTLETILFLDLGLPVTEVNTKKVQKQESKKH